MTHGVDAPERILDEVIDRIVAGDEWQSVVHRNPMVGEEIRALAEIAESLAAPEPGFAGAVAVQRERIWSRITDRPAGVRRWARRFILEPVREWHREAPTVFGMMLTSVMSSTSLLTVIAVGGRSLG